MRQKNNDQIFTPVEIVKLMLDNIGYKGNVILTQKIMEPSCGNGAFLVEIVNRIVRQAKRNNLSANEIALILSHNIYGIEKDPNLHQECIKNLNNVLVKHNIPLISWNNIINGDTTKEYVKYKCTFDFVVGNPPYIRIHHYDEELKKQIANSQFCSGMSDLYVYFYEMGLDMLNDSGKLVYITPNSFLKNASQQAFRDYCIENKLLAHIIDFGSANIFENVDTYVAICMLNKQPHRHLFYQSSTTLVPGHIVKIKLSYISKYMRNKKWYFSDLDIMNSIYATSIENTLQGHYNVQYGIATNADKLYISKAYIDQENKIEWVGEGFETVWFNGYKIEPSILRKCIKASTYNGVFENTYIVFPYVYKEGKCTLIEEEILKKDYPLAYKYLKKHKSQLLTRSMNDVWYAFGRNQGLSTINNKKVVFSHIMKRNHETINAFIVDEDVIVYSGLFTTSIDGSLSDFCKIVSSKEFKQYCCIVGKDMANQYISINGKAVSSFQIN